MRVPVMCARLERCFYDTRNAPASWEAFLAKQQDSVGFVRGLSSPSSSDLTCVVHEDGCAHAFGCASAAFGLYAEFDERAIALSCGFALGIWTIMQQDTPSVGQKSLQDDDEEEPAPAQHVALLHGQPPMILHALLRTASASLAARGSNTGGRA